MKLQNSLASLQTRASDSGLAFWGEGSGERGDDDDIVMQTPRTTSPEEPFYSVFLQYFRDVGPSHIVTNCTLDCELDIGLREGFRRNLEIGWGEACFFPRYLKYFGHVVVHC